MSFDEDVKKVLLRILEDCDGNRAAAAARLGVNPVTFWMWVEGKRKPIRDALSQAIDASGAFLVIPGEQPQENNLETATLKEELKKTKVELKKVQDEQLRFEGEVRLLKEQKKEIEMKLYAALQSNSDSATYTSEKMQKAGND